MITYFVYDLGTGEIDHEGICHPTVFDLQPLPVNHAIIDTEGVTGAEGHYVDGGNILVRTSYPYSINKTEVIANGQDTVEISGLHVPTTVVWPDGEETIETDGYATFTLDMPGVYTVQLSATPYLTEVVDVTAINPN